MSQEIITEFLGTFKIQANSKLEYYQQQAAVVSKLQELGIEIINIATTQSNMETASEEWDQWNKIDQIFEEMEEQITESSKIKMTDEDVLFSTYPDLKEKFEQTANDLGICLDNFDFLQLYEKDGYFELVYQDIIDDYSILCVEVYIDASGVVSISNMSIEGTFGDEDEFENDLTNSCESEFEFKDDYEDYLDKLLEKEISDKVLDD